MTDVTKATTMSLKHVQACKLACIHLYFVRPNMYPLFPVPFINVHIGIEPNLTLLFWLVLVGLVHEA